MAGEVRADDAPGVPRPEGPGYLRSVLVGLLALATGAGAGWLMMLPHLLHPDILKLLVSLAVCTTFVPAFIIGLLDRRRPGVTCLVSVGLVAIVVGCMTLVGSGPGWWTGAPLLAAIGTAFGVRIRAVRHGPAVAAAVLGVTCLAVFVVPEIGLRREASRFAAQRLPEVRAAAAEAAVRVPDTGLTWRHEPQGGVWRGIELRTAWQTTTRGAGPGHCTLRLRTRTLSLTEDLAHSPVEVDFAYRPTTAGRVRTREEATALLAALGVRYPDPELKRRADGAWAAGWMPQMEHPPLPHCTVVASGTGEVTAEVYYALND